MGKVYSMLTRPVRTFNIANRAEKVISQEKPIPAPQYASTEKQKRLSKQANPSFLEDHYRKNPQLDQRLKDVFVTSTDVQEKMPREKPKLLPQNRGSMEEYVFNFYDAIVIPKGKCSLTQAFTFLLQHKHDSVTYSSEKIAAEYTLDKKIVDDILKHFKLYVNIDPKNPELETESDPLQQMIDRNIEYKKRKKLEEKKK